MTTDEVIDLIKTGFMPPDKIEDGNRIIFALNARIAEEVKPLWNQINELQSQGK